MVTLHTVVLGPDKMELERFDERPQRTQRYLLLRAVAVEVKSVAVRERRPHTCPVEAPPGASMRSPLADDLAAAERLSLRFDGTTAVGSKWRRGARAIDTPNAS